MKKIFSVDRFELGNAIFVFHHGVVLEVKREVNKPIAQRDIFYSVV